MGIPKIWLWLALPAVAACAGGAGSAEHAPAGPQPSSQVQSEQKLHAAQESALAALCERLVDCSVESARANMSPEEVAKLDVENTAPRLRDECEEEGARSNWSPRQVRVVQRCVSQAATCETLETCLDEAKKHPQ